MWGNDMTTGQECSHLEMKCRGRARRRAPAARTASPMHNAFEGWHAPFEQVNGAVPAMSSPAAPLAEGSPVRFSSGKYCNRNLTGTILKLTLLAAIHHERPRHACTGTATRFEASMASTVTLMVTRLSLSLTVLCEQ